MKKEKIIKQILKNKKIISKSQNYALYLEGLLGNIALTWNTAEEILKSNWKGKICIRGMGIKRKQPRYKVPLEKLNQTIKEMITEGIPKDTLKFNQSMPDNNLTIQGEIIRTHKGLSITYTHIKKPMNIALKEQELLAEGLKANLILKNFLWPASYNEIMNLLDFFSKEIYQPSCVIEFSTYDTNIGNLPGRNTVIWEVRDY